MTRVELTSSVMTSAGYDAASAILEIEFRRGTIYQYVDVPATEYEALLTSSSKGRFFHARLEGMFAYRRID